MPATTRVHPDRVRALRSGAIGPGPVVYWMRRDQRVRDNWALLYAQDLARAHDRPLAVAFCLVPEFLGAARRQFAFMLDGLEQVARDLDYEAIQFNFVASTNEGAVRLWQKLGFEIVGRLPGAQKAIVESTRNGPKFSHFPTDLRGGTCAGISSI